MYQSGWGRHYYRSESLFKINSFLLLISQWTKSSFSLYENSRSIVFVNKNPPTSNYISILESLHCIILILLKISRSVKVNISLFPRRFPIWAWKRLCIVWLSFIFFLWFSEFFQAVHSKSIFFFFLMQRWSQWSISWQIRFHFHSLLWIR